MAGAGFQSNTTFCDQMCAPECHGLKTIARFVAFRGQIMSEPVILWLSAGKFYQGFGIPQFIGEWWLAFRGMFESGMPQV
jgi:hypothetical protein